MMRSQLLAVFLLVVHAYGANATEVTLSRINDIKEALNKYRHSQIFRILNGSWESFDDFQPLSPSPGLEIGLYGF
jgi:hypothetical protein